MYTRKKIALMIENKLGYTNGWRVDDETYENELLMVADELIKLFALPIVVSSKPARKSLRQIIEERRTNLCLTAEILKKDGKNETFFVGKYELLDNILNEFDGIEEAN